MVALFRAPPFPPIVGLGLSRGLEVWVMLFLLLVSVYARNHLPLDCPGCHDWFDNSTARFARCLILTQSWRRLLILRFLWRDCAVLILPAISCSGYCLRRYIAGFATEVTLPRPAESFWEKTSPAGSPRPPASRPPASAIS